MTTKELTKHAVMTGLSQLEGALKGLEAKDWGMKINEHTMSASEMVEHLIECRHACTKSFKGEQHEWGTFSAGDKSPEGLMKSLREETEQAMKMYEEMEESDDNSKHALDYLAMHDAYHVGQLVSLRLTLDPNWNSYAIYGY